MLAELRDEEKEVDPPTVLKHLNKLLLRFAPHVEKYDPTTGRSVIDYLKNRISDARLAVNREQLLDLYQDWKIVSTIIV